MSGAILTLMGATGGGGGGATTITVAYQNINAYASGAAATATYQLNSNGSVYERINSDPYSLVLIGPNWCVPASQAGNYECYATLVDGSSLGIGSSALNTWLPLTTTREWFITTPLGAKFATLNVGIRRIDGIDIVSNDIDLYVEVF
jgi:hypothetical protein